MTKKPVNPANLSGFLKLWVLLKFKFPSQNRSIWLDSPQIWSLFWLHLFFCWPTHGLDSYIFVKHFCQALAMSRITWNGVDQSPLAKTMCFPSRIAKTFVGMRWFKTLSGFAQTFAVNAKTQWDLVNWLQHVACLGILLEPPARVSQAKKCDIHRARLKGSSQVVWILVEKLRLLQFMQAGKCKFSPWFRHPGISLLA